MQMAMLSPERTIWRCLVCGSNEVRTDEVVDRGIVMLAECPRCDHRWTESPALTISPLVVRVSPARRFSGEVDSVA